MDPSAIVTIAASAVPIEAAVIAWKAFYFVWPLVGGALTSVLMLRRKERISWEESAKGHLAKLRHEALAKCLAGVGELYELDIALPRDTDAEKAAYAARVAEPLRAVAGHEFMLPPDLRREVQGLLNLVRPNEGSSLSCWEQNADTLCRAIDLYLPPIQRRVLPTGRATSTPDEKTK